MITNKKLPYQVYSPSIDRLQVCAPELRTVYIPSEACCVYPLTEKRVPMHFIIYGIIIGVAIAAILIVRLGDVQHPATVSSKSHPGNAPWFDYDHPEELS